MQTTPVTYENLRDSIIAVPPLCRDADYRICKTENEKLVRHIEAGGVSSLLYGGNANLYHVRVSEYAQMLEMLSEIAGDKTLVVPSVGPAYGLMMDQADLLRDTKFPTVMVLPADAVMTESGLLRGFRHFVEAIGRPAVLYIKREGYITPEGAAKLVDDGLVSFIKYAIVRDDPAVDPFLDQLVDCVDRKLIVSGIGEQPAIVHLKQFGITGFTSGCVCVAPGLSQQMLQALYADDVEKAESIRKTFLPLEDLRNGINPIRVLHQAVASAGIAATGPQIPLLDEIDPSRVEEIRVAATELLAAAK
ncbi:5-dehydro-4-deoxyglucarate dehydratase [Rosistilla oblonga]|uniref:dihydrodipicolinate synthase family protein n=1 Tax=Rosistilla oblonga TaxID=2527990 RepID=UPI00118C775F|nr:dihydrodipicolinate synthase family protein [Rosistilla oblonga]QDV13140.1 5-dehydro-4-deoxyglucarate dehydratase [Rosistilla oblonga]